LQAATFARDRKELPRPTPFVKGVFLKKERRWEENGF